MTYYDLVAKRDLHTPAYIEYLRKKKAYDDCVNPKIEPMKYLPDYDLEENGHAARVFRRCDGEDTATFTYYVDFQELKPEYQTKVSGPLTVSYGQDLIIDLDPGNKDASFVIKGTVGVTNQKIDIDQQTAINSLPLRLKGISKQGDRYRATFVLLP